MPTPPTVTVDTNTDLDADQNDTDGHQVELAVGVRHSPSWSRLMRDADNMDDMQRSSDT